MIPASEDRERKLLEDWLFRLKKEQFSHIVAARRFARGNRVLGVLAVVFSTSVGTAVFSMWEQKLSGVVGLLLGLTSITAAVLASLQTFLGLADRAERHRSSSARFAAIRREVEEILHLTPAGDLRQIIPTIRRQIDEVTDSSPEIPASIADNSKWSRLLLGGDDFSGPYPDG